MESMPSATTIAASFRSEREFTQESFRTWLASGLAPELGKQELLGGRIVSSPPAGWSHATIASNLNRLLGSHVRANQLGRVLESSAGYELPSGDTLQPDVSFISAETWAAAAGTRSARSQFLRVVPNLVVEILSPSTAHRDRTEKLEIYSASGVDEYWIVDPARREVALFTREGGGYAAALSLRTGSIPSRVLPEFTADVAELFEGIEA